MNKTFLTLTVLGLSAVCSFGQRRHLYSGMSAGPTVEGPTHMATHYKWETDAGWKKESSIIAQCQTIIDRNKQQMKSMNVPGMSIADISKSDKWKQIQTIITNATNTKQEHEKKRAEIEKQYRDLYPKDVSWVVKEAGPAPQPKP